MTGHAILPGFPEILERPPTPKRWRRWGHPCVLGVILWSVLLLLPPVALGQLNRSPAFSPTGSAPSLFEPTGGPLRLNVQAETKETASLGDEAYEDRIGRTVKDSMEKAGEISREIFGGQAVLLGLALSSAKLNLFRNESFQDGRTPSAKLTNNGELGPVARYTTSETYLWEHPMRTGWFRFGYDFEVSYTSFQTDRQETLNVIEGEDLGTTSSGKMLATGAMIFVRLGPLYPDGDIYWKGGGGGGVGWIDFEADVLFRNNLSDETSRERVSHDSLSPNLYLLGLWMLEWGNWQFIYIERNLRGNTNFGTFFFTETSTILGYTLRF